ncbi:hypothetical protein SAMN02745857_03759 [Andreprevotia lacus DSM 23236]|jgi:hypothetical protein|uniref:Uncharacterized protein n=1 Tax=Andreprevotia lacus DSM 23236 TaxID=1121001 RepID=A0A1W1Y0N8_9NEIS|nr:hypothetical protein [Andreprevotia lacus]SMC29318.1 hypothetical protein SAMN02745857_03759 [Andreprevotia lacus DSM 23236]
MKLALIAGLALALSSAFASAADTGTSQLLATSNSASDSGLMVVATCTPRPLPACSYGTPGSQYYCPLTQDDIARLTCTGPYANG